MRNEGNPRDLDSFSEKTYTINLSFSHKGSTKAEMGDGKGARKDFCLCTLHDSVVVVGGEVGKLTVTIHNKL